jgi:hypothetical protein
MERRVLLPIIFSAAAAATLITACNLYYTPQQVEYKVSPAPSLIQEGKRLTQIMCSPCHYDPATKKLTGIHMEDVPGFIGKVIASNITNHPEKGIGKYTDGELAYIIRTGVAKDGKIMPFMQKPNLSDKDLQAIIAFLRSDDELVTASDADRGNTRYTVLGKMGMSKQKPLPYPTKEIPDPDRSNKVAYGKYLIDNYSCFDCHSKSFMAVDRMEPERSKGYMGGGNKLKDRSGKTVLSSNLTFHETGIGGWTEAEFSGAVRKGIGKNNKIVAYPMPVFNEITDEEISAMYEYLKTIPRINNSVTKR